MSRYKVLQSMKSEFENPIKLKKYQIVTVIEKSDPSGEWPGWILCKTEDNEGWVPHQIVGDEGIVLEDYNAIEFDLLVGEILIEEKQLNGWLWCSKKDNVDVKAWAPLNHIEIIESS